MTVVNEFEVALGIKFLKLRAFFRFQLSPLVVDIMSQLKAFPFASPQ